ncbi:MAG: hypothetical protein ACJ73E_14125 [Mycobacteriales bacterium]
MRPRAEVAGDTVVYTFGNGLVVTAEVAGKDDPLRILPLGPVQEAVLHYLATSPGCARGKGVFEPFAGSGAFGLMALLVGASAVDLLDVNPRARAFQLRSARLNRFGPERLRCLTGDLATFVPDRRYDLLLANPPFVPTPDGIEGTLSSNGGPDGNRFAGLLLHRLDELLQPDGEAVLCLFQLVRDGVPLIADTLGTGLPGRSVEFSPLQACPVPFESYCAAYERQHPAALPAIRRWRAALSRGHSDQLGLAHHLMHIRPATSARGELLVRDRPAERFGGDFVIAAGHEDSAPVDGRRR